MPEATRKDIWIYIYEKGEVRSKDLEKQFEKTKLLSHGTVYKYKDDLEKEGKIRARFVPNARPPYNVYYVPEEFHEELEAMKQIWRIRSFLDNLSPREQIATVDLWFEIEEVVNSMIEMGYSPEEIRGMVENSLDELHTKLVNRIVQDNRTDDSIQ